MQVQRARYEVEAVQSGNLWLPSDPTSEWAEEIPSGLLKLGFCRLCRSRPATCWPMSYRKPGRKTHDCPDDRHGVVQWYGRQSAAIRRALDHAFRARLLERTSAQARLQAHELENQADALEDLGKTTARCNLQFSVRIALGGDPPTEVVERANELLAEIGRQLMLQ